MKKIGLIPCRMESVRLPDKPLKLIEGIPMYAHVYYRSIMSNLDNVYVCTDSHEISKDALKHNIPCIMTSVEHLNGTERCAEAAESLSLSQDSVIIDIQGDEALVDPSHINLLIEEFTKHPCDIIVPYLEFTEMDNVNVVKLLTTCDDTVIAMSRSDIPNTFRQKVPMKKHLDIIIFTNKSLQKFSKLQPSYLESIEGIELMRAIEHKMYVRTVKFEGETCSVNTQDDLNYVRAKMKSDELYPKYANR